MDDEGSQLKIVTIDIEKVFVKDDILAGAGPSLSAEEHIVKDDTQQAGINKHISDIEHIFHSFNCSLDNRCNTCYKEDEEERR